MLSLIAYSIAQEREKLKVFLRHYLWFPFLYFVIQPIAFIKGLNEYIFMKQDGKWRKRSKEKSRYLFSTIVDVFATFVVINIAMHILDDEYTIFQNYELVKQVIFFLILKAGYVILYYTKIRFGEKLVDRSYPLFLNISFYLIIISFIDNFIRIINYEARTLSQKKYFVISEIKLFAYIVGIIILYNVFKNIIDKKNNNA